MDFKINYNGRYEDSIVISGDSVKEIKEKADCELIKRGWEKENCWAERVGGERQ